MLIQPWFYDVLLHGAAESWALSRTQHLHQGTRGENSSIAYDVIIKERRLRWLGHAARRSDNNMVEQLLFATRIPGHVQPVGRPCGSWMHYAMRDVKDMGQP